jgi:thiol-disulfide isomerase/thioredoxin
MKIIHLFMVLFFSNISFGQKKLIVPLAIGSKVPDIGFNKVLNYKSNKAKLSDFKGKLIILDMWATTCTSCIAYFPHMDSLQKQFKDKIQILLVNPHKTNDETLDRIKNVMEKFKVRTGFYPSLPIPIYDTILNAYFPHKTVPHEVWIDGNGKLIAITNAFDVNAENIQTVLSGKPLNVDYKNDLQEYDRNNPLEFDWHGDRVKPKTLYYSAFTRYMGGVGGCRPAEGTKFNGNNINEITGFFIINTSLRGFLFRAYYKEFNEFPESRVVLNVRNPLQYKLGWDTAYMYCYDLTVPPTSSKDFNFKQRVYLKEDLKRFFNVTVTRKNIRLKSLILTSTDSVSKSFTKFEKRMLEIDRNSIKKYFHNYPLNEMVKILGGRLSVPLVNESAITQNIDLDFPDNFDWSNVEGLKRVLENAGFAIKEEERELEVIIISDKITEPVSVPSAATSTKNAAESDTAIIKRQLTGYSTQKNSIAIDFVAANPNSQYSPIVISDLWYARKIDSSEGMSLYKNLSADVQQSMWGLMLKAQIQKTANDLKIPVSPFTFQLSGKIAGLTKGDTIYLLHRKFPNHPVDTTIKIVEENAFTFLIRRPVAGAAFYRLKIGKNSNKILKIFLNNEKVTITGTAADFDKANVQGAKANDDYLRYSELTKPMDGKINSLNNILKKYYSQL